MLRVILAALFFIAFSVPSFAHSPWSCSYCRGADSSPSVASPAASPDDLRLGAAQSVSAFTGSLNGPLAMSVIYPGIVVLMTMTAYYFLRVMEPQVRRDHPHFIRTTACLSALWLLGFYPFLSSALGGFLFCVTATACIGGWFVVRHFAVQARLWERLIVLWTFFFFSLLAGVIATGHGRSVGAVFDGVLEFARHAGAVSGPFLLFAVNGGALLLVFRMAGVSLPRPTEPDSILRFKIYGLVVAVAVFDTYVTAYRAPEMEWLSWPLLALPSLAYYGAYWTVSRLPDGLRLRAGLVLFVTLALFLVMLACFAAGAPVAAMLLALTALAHAASLAFGLAILWRSEAAKPVKLALSAAAAAFVFAAGFVVLALGTFSPMERELFIRERLVLGLLTPSSLTVLLLGFGYGVYFIFSARFSPRAKLALTAVMISFLFLLQACFTQAVPAVLGAELAAANSGIEYAGVRR